MRSVIALFLTTAMALVAGCNTADDAAPEVNAITVNGSAYLLDEKPEGAQPVIQAREAAQDDQEVVVLGRIGGDVNPWVEGVAAFSIVDPTLQACSDRPGDACETPWDYCCEVPALRTGKALVKVVDEEGNVVKSDARELLSVKELDTVIVEGTADRDDAGNLTVLARRIYVQK